MVPHPLVGLHNIIHLLENVRLALMCLFWLIELGNQLLGGVMRVMVREVQYQVQEFLAFHWKDSGCTYVKTKLLQARKSTRSITESR